MHAKLSPQTHRSLSTDTVLALLVGFVVLVAFNIHRFLYGETPVFPTDDAYITLHNAVVLVSGKPDPNFVGTAALCGSTSLVHVALTALFCLALPPLTALNLTLWLGILLYGLGLMRLARVHGAAPWQAALLMLAGLFAAQTPFQMLNGLETGLALAGVTWALVFASQEKSTRGLAVLCGLLPFLRPELIVLSVLLLAKERKLASLGWALSAMTPFLLLLWANTGSVIPQTIAAKRAYFAESGLPLGEKLAIAGRHLGAFAALVGTGAIFLPTLVRTSLGRIGLLFALVLIAAYVQSLPMALLQYYHRYLYVLLPFLWLGCASLWRLKKSLGQAASIGAALVLAQGLFTFPTHWSTYEGWYQEVSIELDGLTKFCDTIPDEEGPLLLHDAGYMGFAGRKKLVDMVGLKTPAAIPLHQRLTEPSVGKKRLDAVEALAKEKHCGFLVVLQGWEEFHRIGAGLQARGWTVTPVRAFAPDYPVPERNRYQVYKLTSPSLLSSP
ncbi:MAG: hypothetical protein NTX57_14630 [Armatimonadetes bacterium]|nr:hypothetical protein [Armatimonadota bacterium]